MKEEIKQHIQKHKVVYSCAATGIVFAGITAVIMRRYSLGGRIMATEEWSGRIMATKPQAIISSNLSNSFNTTNNNFDRTPPLSYITKEVGTDKWWISQADVSRETGISESLLSKHINHGKSLANGKEYARIGIAA